MASDDEVQVRITASIADLKAKLADAKLSIAEFKGQIAEFEQASASGAKVTTEAFMGMQQAQASLARTQREAVIIAGQLAAAQKQIGPAMEEATHAGINMESMLTRIAFRFVAMQLVIRPVIQAIKETVKAYEDQQAALQAIDAALESTGTATAANTEKVIEATAAISKLSDFTATDLNNAFAKLVERGHDANAALTLIQAAADLAAGTHIKLAKAAQDLGSALEGQITALENDGIAFSGEEKILLKYMDAADRLAVINAKVEDSFGGQAAAMDQHAPSWQHFTSNVLAAVDAVGKFHLIHDLIGLGTGVGGNAPVTSDLEARAKAATATPTIVQAQGQIALEDAKAAATEEDERKIENAINRERDAEDRASEAARKHAEAVEEAAARAAAAQANAAREAGAFYDRITQAANISSSALDPLAAALKRVDAQFQAMADSAQAAKEPISQVIAYYRQLAEQAFMQAAAEETAKALEKLQDEQDKWSERIDKTNQKLSELVSEGDLTVIEQETQKLSDAVTAQIDLYQNELEILIARFNAETDPALLEAEQKRIDQLRQELQYLQGIKDNVAAIASTTINAQQFGNEFADALVAGIQGGSVEAAFKSLNQKIAKDFTSGLAKGIIGLFTGTDQNAGPNETPQQKADFAQTQAQAAGIANATLAAGAGIEQAITQGTKETVAQMAVSAAATGYAVAIALAETGYGVIAGVIVGLATFAAGLFSPADNTGKYYTHIDIKDNKVNFNADTGHQGLGYSSDQIKEIYQSIQKTIDTFYNGYIETLAKFSNFAQLVAQVPLINGNELQNAWNHAASKGFNDTMNAWIKTGLPGMIQDSFWTPLAEGLQTLGLSSSEIALIHDTMNTMAPEDALKYVTSLVTAVQGINKVLLQLSGGAQGDSWGSVGFAQAAFNAVHGSFTGGAQQTITDLETMATALNSLSGQAQIDYLQQMVDKSEAYYRSVIQYEEKIQSIMDSINASAQAGIDKYTLAGMKTASGAPDYQAEINYVTQEYNAAVRAIHTAQTPEDVQKAEQQAQAYLDEIMGFASHGSAATQEAFRLWAIQQLNLLKSASDQQLASMKSAIEQQAEAIEKMMEPYVNAFKDATAALENLANPVDQTTSGTPGGGSGTGGHQPPSGMSPPAGGWYSGANGGWYPDPNGTDFPSGGGGGLPTYGGDVTTPAPYPGSPWPDPIKFFSAPVVSSLTSLNTSFEKQATATASTNSLLAAILSAISTGSAATLVINVAPSSNAYSRTITFSRLGAR